MVYLTLSVIEISGNGNDGVCHFVTEISFLIEHQRYRSIRAGYGNTYGDVAHFTEDHSGDLFGCEELLLGSDFDVDDRFGFAFDDVERKVFDVSLHGNVLEFAANQALSIEDRILGIRCQLILGSVTYQTFTFGSESHVRWRDAVALVVGNNFHTAILEDTNA